MLSGRLDRRELVVRYLLAVLISAAATGVTFLVRSYVDASITPPLILAVALSALFGGRGPGLLSAAIGQAALTLWFFPPLQAPPGTDLARTIMFLIVSMVTALIAGTLHEQRGRALEKVAENDRLRRLGEEEAARARDAAAEAEIAAQEAADAMAGQQQAEAALRQREAELADFFETASVALHWVAEDGTVLRVNQAALDLLGYRREEFVGRAIGEFHLDPPVIEDILRRARKGETVRQQPARIRGKDGRILHVEIDCSGYFHEGRFAHTRCFTRDVTRERQAQEAVARLAAIVTSSSDAIVGKTLDGTITSWNAAAERIFGYSAAEMVGDSIFKLIPPEYHEQESQVLEQLRRGAPVKSSEAERIRKDGRRIWISLSVSPVRDAAGTIIGAASIKRDVTDQKVLEERLRDTQRLQSVGQLAGGIAHEANNQMSVVLGGVHFLQRRHDLTEAARADLELIRQAAERTASITQQLLAFSRRQRLQLQDVNLNDVVQSIGPVLRRSLTEDQEMVVRLGLMGGTVRADPRQLEQVLLNLTLNARDAMPGGGRLTIETMDLTFEGEEAARQGVPPGTYESLIVTDTGRGMNRATLDRVFEPFYTTKAVGHGTGLGLSVVHGIVTQLGGQIRVESTLGGGSTFKLYFPLASHLGVGKAAKPSPPQAANPGAVTLVVEDDPLVRGMAVRLLAEAGYRVLEAGNGRSALELARKQPRLDLVLTDVGLPGMDGYELARCLREERPGLPVIFMTGYTGADTTKRSTPVPGTVVQKPFSPMDLVRVAQETIAANATDPS